MMESNKQFIVASIPEGKLSESHFRFQEIEIPTAQPDEILVRTIYFALDAASRAWLQGETYRAALQVGDLMPGMALAEVIKPQASHFKKGDLVMVETGWQTYATVSFSNLQALPKITTLPNLLSVFGVPGLTAYFGLLRCTLPKEGKTLLVSAAAGAVGSIAGQLGKLLGCKVIGIAGGQEKCNLLKEKLGFDVALDYKNEDFKENLAKACPKGIDIYFDNVGGQILEIAIANMAQYGQIVCCGAISQYDQKDSDYNLSGIPNKLILKSLSIRGFLLFDYLHEKDVAIKDLTEWLQSDKIIVIEDIIDGFENLPKALVGVLNGENIGKRLVRV